MTAPDSTHLSPAATGSQDAPALEVPVQEVAATTARGESKFLRFVSEASVPPIIVTGLLIALAMTSNAGPGRGLLWGLLASLFVSAIPYTFIVVSVRRGKLSDRMLTNRRQRHIPNLCAISSAILGWIILAVADAPAPVVAFTASAILSQVVVSLTALVWKMSLHLSTAGGIASLVAILAGPWTLLVSLPLVALIAASRLILREHTPAQVIVGAVVGAIMVPGFYFLVL